MGQIQPQRELPAELAAAIRTAREARGWSRRVAARHAGVSKSMIGALEQGIRVPSEAVAADLAAVFELPADTAAWLARVAVRGRGRSRPLADDLESGRPHGRRIDDLPTLTLWLRGQTSGSSEQLRAFLACCDRGRLEALDREMRYVGQAVREFVAADDALVLGRKWAESLAQALDNLERPGRR